MRNESLPEELPVELDKWNWGAFLLTWIWGLGNGTYRALLMFVPFVNIVIWIMLGLKGSKWAWQNFYWKDVQHFKDTQRKWAIGGLVFYGAAIVLGFGLVFTVMGLMKNSNAYTLAMSQIRASSQVTEILGTPIKEGFFVSGNVNTSRSGGSANLNISLTGPKASATAHVQSQKYAGQWKTNRLFLTFEDGTPPLSVINTTSGPDFQNASLKD